MRRAKKTATPDPKRIVATKRADKPVTKRYRPPSAYICLLICPVAFLSAANIAAALPQEN